MKFALIMIAALGAAPQPATQLTPPVRVLVGEGDSFRCELPGGCYVANEAGIEALVREVSKAAREQCRGTI